MKRIKLDENFPPSLTQLFTKEHIDASSVLEQNLSGEPDDSLFNIIVAERRTLVTFDLDFANIIRYPADKTDGIIVCRLRRQISLQQISLLCDTIIRLINTHELQGRLFVIDGDKIRMRKPEDI